MFFFIKISETNNSRFGTQTNYPNIWACGNVMGPTNYHCHTSSELLLAFGNRRLFLGHDSTYPSVTLIDLLPLATYFNSISLLQTFSALGINTCGIDDQIGQLSKDNRSVEKI